MSAEYWHHTINYWRDKMHTEYCDWAAYHCDGCRERVCVGDCTVTLPSESYAHIIECQTPIPMASLTVYGHDKLVLTGNEVIRKDVTRELKGLRQSRRHDYEVLHDGDTFQRYKQRGGSRVAIEMFMQKGVVTIEGYPPLRPTGALRLTEADFRAATGGTPNLLVRAGVDDVAVLYEVKNPRTYGMVECAGRRVLDLGGFGGHFATLAMQRGAKDVICVEAEPRNYRMCRLNLSDLPRTRVIYGAVVGQQTDTGYLPIYSNADGYMATSSRYPGKDGKLVTQVPTVPIEHLYATNPEIIKLDVEGSEYDILFNGPPIPLSVEQVFLEMHLTRKFGDVPGLEAAERLVGMFSDWTMTMAPKIQQGHRCTYAYFVR